MLCADELDVTDLVTSAGTIHLDVVISQFGFGCLQPLLSSQPVVEARLRLWLGDNDTFTATAADHLKDYSRDFPSNVPNRDGAQDFFLEKTFTVFFI
jgi:hypothetical protein